MAFELNYQQAQTVKLAKKWYKNLPKQTFEISGPPGTGKSTIVSVLVDELQLQAHEVLFVAFIGKAAQSLAMKGNNAKTIHSAIYNVEQSPVLLPDGTPKMVGGKVVNRRQFKKKETLGKDVKLIILDEAGTVDTNLGMDLLSFGVPVIALGDIDQLPPVFGSCPFLKKPDVILTEFMRQAEDSEIIWMFQQVKEGKRIPYGRYNNSLVIRPEDVTDEMLKKVSMVIAGRNKTRDNVIKYFRENIMKIDKDAPLMLGEKIVCRKNNWNERIDVDGLDINLINGLVGYVDDINLSGMSSSVMEIDFRPDFSEFDMFRNIDLDLDYLLTPCAEEFKNITYSNKFQYAYALSVHLTQGSQYDSVLYFKESFSQSPYQRSLDYVGLSRATQFNILVQ